MRAARHLPGLRATYQRLEHGRHDTDRVGLQAEAFRVRLQAGAPRAAELPRPSPPQAGPTKAPVGAGAVPRGRRDAGRRTAGWSVPLMARLLARRAPWRPAREGIRHPGGLESARYAFGTSWYAASSCPNKIVSEARRLDAPPSSCRCRSPLPLRSRKPRPRGCCGSSCCLRPPRQRQQREQSRSARPRPCHERRQLPCPAGPAARRPRSRGPTRRTPQLRTEQLPAIGR